MDNKVPFKRVVVNLTENPNQFMVHVNDLEQVLESLEKLPDKEESFQYSLERAIFIQQAVEEKMRRS